MVNLYSLALGLVSASLVEAGAASASAAVRQNGRMVA